MKFLLDFQFLLRNLTNLIRFWTQAEIEDDYAYCVDYISRIRWESNLVAI